MAEQIDTSPPTVRMERPPALSVGPLGWVRANLFNTWFNALITVAIVALLAMAIPPAIRWLFVDAIWGSAPPTACRQPGAGACWAFVHEKYRLILFGLYSLIEARFRVLHDVPVQGMAAEARSKLPI